MADRWVCLDVGETLIDETRVWEVWADLLGVTRLTFMAALGAVIADGADHRDVFDVVQRPDWQQLRPAFDEAYGAFRSTDFYPDARPALADLHAAGYRLALVANQPARRTAELRALGVSAEVVAMSGEMGVHKPEPAFFVRSLELMGLPDPADVAYVGDRLDNDVRPSLAAGMRAVWIRRGPWALIAKEESPAGVLVVDSLAELVERIGEAWA
jgi:HAD superfamily hydrolase (TIGR01549 family)